MSDDKEREEIRRNASIPDKTSQLEYNAVSRRHPDLGITVSQRANRRRNTKIVDKSFPSPSRSLRTTSLRVQTQREKC